MTPAAIVKAAKDAGLELIAITDHNSARNCPAVAAEAEKAGIGFIPGIEVTTSEEIHCVCLLPDLGRRRRSPAGSTRCAPASSTVRMFSDARP